MGLGEDDKAHRAGRPSSPFQCVWMTGGGCLQLRTQRTDWALSKAYTQSLSTMETLHSPSHVHPTASLPPTHHPSNPCGLTNREALPGEVRCVEDSMDDFSIHE